MWFKQAQILTINPKMSYTSDTLSTKLERLAYTPCLPSLPATQGWVAPADADEASLVYSIENFWLLCLQTEEKILPATVVRNEVAKRIKQLETERDQKIGRKEKTQLMEEMTQTLLPKAFSKLSRTYAYIDKKNHYLVIDTTSPVKVKQFVDFLMRAAPEISAKPLETKKVPPILTQWLIKQNNPTSFAVNQSCLLRDPNNETRMIRCQQQNLFASSIQALLKEGCLANQLSLTWHDKIDFMLANEFMITGIKYQDEIKSQADEAVSETTIQRFEADFIVMANTLAMMLNELIALFAVNEEILAAEIA